MAGGSSFVTLWNGENSLKRSPTRLCPQPFGPLSKTGLNNTIAFDFGDTSRSSSGSSVPSTIPTKAAR